MNLESTPSVKQIYLASASPRRAELLRQIDVKFETLRICVDEMRKKQENVDGYVTRLALAKANEGLNLATNKAIPVLGADTVVYAAGEILGKPTSFEDAKEMLCLLSGKTHQVITAVALVNAHQSRQVLQRSDVTMREISHAEIAAYWQTKEPQDKAGSYAIQGKAAVFISHINGSYSGVMGLPVYETAKLIREF